MLVSTRQSSRLEKATLTVMPATASPRPGGGKTLTFHFNPKEYTLSKTASWERTDSQVAHEAGPVQWRGPGPRTISDLEIFLDESASATADVTKDVDLLLSCCTPTDKSIAEGKPSGPFVLFGWGNRMSFTAVVTSVRVRFTMFRPNGDPYRAVATLSLEEVDVKTPRQNPTSGTVAAQRTHQLVEGEDLALVAHQEYRNPALWRALAEANGIDDPLRVPDGRAILVPAPEEADQAG